QRITTFGQRMLKLGTHPRLAAMLLAPSERNEQALACDLAALVEARDPLVGYRGDDWQSRWSALMTQRGPTTVDSRLRGNDENVTPQASGARRNDEGATAKSSSAQRDDEGGAASPPRRRGSRGLEQHGVSRAALSALTQAASQ